MAFQTKAAIKEDHLHFEILGNFEIEGLGDVIDKLLAEVAYSRSTKVLIDVRGVRGAPSVLERFQFATLFAAGYLKARAKDSIPSCHFAILGKEPLLDPKRFGEKVALNRGMVLRVFTSGTEAMEWLLKD